MMQCSAGRSLFFRSPWRTDRTDGLWTSCSTNRWDCEATLKRRENVTQSTAWRHDKHFNYLHRDGIPVTHATAGSDGDLDGVPPRLADVLQVQGLVGCFVVPSLDGEGRGVDADLDGGRPVCVHLPVFVVVALELQLQVGPAGGGATGAGREMTNGKRVERREGGGEVERAVPPHERLVDGGS